MRYLTTGILAALLSTSARACLNEYNTHIEGERVVVNSTSAYLPLSYTMDEETLQRDLADRIERLETDRNYQNLSDLAVAYHRMSETLPAIALLLEANDLKPDGYQIVANLGTAYELDRPYDGCSTVD